MYLIADLAVGGNWPGDADATTPFPAAYEIDYIRAYQKHSYVGDDVGYQRMYVILNLAVGGGFDPGATPDPAEFPKTFDIDCVRVYQEKD